MPPKRSDALARARRKAYGRLVPLLFVAFVIAYIDRSNLAIAKLAMTRDLPAFDNGVFGLGGGLFFLGYVLLEIPGTLMVERRSARRWIGRIMISWGLVAALQAFVRRPSEFYVVRFALGLAEAGFMPGAVVYFSHWFPRRDRARVMALFLVGTPVAQLVNPKISGALLGLGGGHDRVLGLLGWQWVYVAWALPAIALGLVVWRILPDWPRDARWLTDDERRALEAAIAHDDAEAPHRHVGVAQAFRHPKVLALSTSYLCAVTAFYGVDLFVPSILVRWYGMDLSTLTWLLVVPAAASVVAQLVAGWSSDRTRERRLHAAVPLAIAAAALALVPASRGHLGSTVALFVLATIGTKAYLPAFWCLPTLLLSGAAAAATTGFVNSFGNLGGFIGSWALGALEQRTGAFDAGLYLIAGAAAIAASGLFAVGLGRRRSAVDVEERQAEALAR